jgi:hypothetical protein
MQICLLQSAIVMILGEPQAIVTFFGFVSVVNFGKTMFKTPFAIDALISSFCTQSVSYHMAGVTKVLTLRPCGNDKLLENLP